MKAKLLLRIAAVLLVVHVLGHAIGHSTWDKPEDPGMKEVVATMKNYSTNFMGATKSMADYYNGYSLMIFGVFAMSILLLWLISGFINEQRNIAHRLLLPIGISYIFFGVVEFLYFFPFAASMSFMAGVLCMLVILTGNYSKGNRHGR